MSTLSPRAPATGSDCTPSPEAHAMSGEAATQVAAMLKALADPLRLRMLSFITTSSTGEACVCDIATVADVSQPTVSHHLKVLKEVGVLTSERRGTWVWYRVPPGVKGAVSALLESFAPAALDAARHREQPLAGLEQVDATLTRVADQLAARFADLAPELVLRTVRESYAALARRAGISAHLVPTAQRFAAQRLADITRTTTPDQAHVPQVLFVCVANAGRSQLAAALLHHHAGDTVLVRSAGSAPAADVHAAVRPLLAELGTDAEAVFPKPLTDDAVRAADVVITMGCGDTCPVLPGKRYEDWVVGDPALASPEGARAIRDDIDARVRALLSDLLPTTPEEHPMTETTTTDQTPTGTDKPSVLFVCVHNAGRSQMAAGFLTALAGGAVEVRSAGSAPADQINPAAVEAMLELGIDIRAEKPKILTTDAVRASDIVITMGCGDTCPFFPGKRYEDWVLEDPAGQGVEAVRPIRDEIRARILTLLGELGVQPVDA
jgi:arsenate reductase